jgi:flavin-dependent dehydrogenase
MTLLKLHNGSRIAIIGGGPAGTFFAHFALELARQRGLDVTITILDGKNFLRQGPPGCNMCAGVISETLLARLEKEGIRLPEGRVQRRIDGYYMQTADSGLLLKHPQGKRGAIRTVYRGSGPRFGSETTGVSFDDFLLSHVKERGVQVIEQVVAEVILPSDAQQPIRLRYGGPGAQTEFEADLVVGAFGLNTAILEKIIALDFGYRPPRFVRAFQAELKLGANHIRGHLGNNIYVFSLGLNRIRFAGFTPKSEHVTASVIGFKDASVSDLRELLAQPSVRPLLPPGDILANRFCRCRPRIGVTPCRKPFTDRLVIVGDASCSRYYKNGLESAFVTAQLAAEAAFNSGISESAFHRDYWRKLKRTIIRDNLYGRLLFKVCDLASRHGILRQTYCLVAASGREADSVSQLARQVLWDLFTGNVPYRTIFFRALNLRLQARLTITTLGLVVQKTRSLVSGKGRGRMRRSEPQESKR